MRADDEPRSRHAQILFEKEMQLVTTLGAASKVSSILHSFAKVQCSSRSVKGKYRRVNLAVLRHWRWRIDVGKEIAISKRCCKTSKLKKTNMRTSRYASEESSSTVTTPTSKTSHCTHRASLSPVFPAKLTSLEKTKPQKLARGH